MGVGASQPQVTAAYLVGELTELFEKYGDGCIDPRARAVAEKGSQPDILSTFYKKYLLLKHPDWSHFIPF